MKNCTPYSTVQGRPLDTLEVYMIAMMALMGLIAAMLMLIAVDWAIWQYLLVACFILAIAAWLLLVAMGYHWTQQAHAAAAKKAEPEEEGRDE